jgi:hypothetical protein
VDSISYVPAGPTVERFHASNAFVRGLMGPVGSSKSTACCIEILSRAQEQKAFNGVRRTRWAVIRNTYPELKVHDDQDVDGLGCWGGDEVGRPDQSRRLTGSYRTGR